MDFALSEELIAVRDLAREFAEKEIAPSAAKDDKEKNFRPDLVKKMGELGFYGTMIPETYGGNGLGFLAMVLVTEEIARAHSAMRVAINMQIGPALTLLQFGSEEQKKKFIPPLVAGEKIGCFAITEPDAGSDVAALRTTATKDGERYLLNGSKLWISNAPVTHGGLVYAYTDRSQKHRGMSGFLCRLGSTGFDPQAARNHGRALLADRRNDLRQLSNSRREPARQRGRRFQNLHVAAQSNPAQLRRGRVRSCARLQRGGGELLQSAGSIRPEDRRVSDEPGSDRADDRARRSGAPAGLSRGVARRSEANPTI